MKILYVGLYSSFPNFVNELINTLQDELKTVILIDSFREAIEVIRSQQFSIIFLENCEKIQRELLGNFQEISILPLIKNLIHSENRSIQYVSQLKTNLCIYVPLNYGQISDNILEWETAKHQSTPIKDQSNYFTVHHNNKLIKVEHNDIEKIKASGCYCELYTKTGKKYVVAKSLGQIESFLSENNFIRIHHSCIINKHCIEQIKNGRSIQVQLQGGGIELVSQRKKTDFLRCIQAI